MKVTVIALGSMPFFTAHSPALARALVSLGSSREAARAMASASFCISRRCAEKLPRSTAIAVMPPRTEIRNAVSQSTWPLCCRLIRRRRLARVLKGMVRSLQSHVRRCREGQRFGHGAARKKVRDIAQGRDEVVGVVGRYDDGVTRRLPAGVGDAHGVEVCQVQAFDRHADAADDAGTGRTVAVAGIGARWIA